MKLLVVAGAYPSASHPFSAIFTERCALALGGICEKIEVLATRPYVPPFLARLPRWRVYGEISAFELRNGIPVYRPATPVIPRLGTGFWWDPAPFFWSYRTALRMHRRVGFDAIASFDILGGGATAWRLGRKLGIPASGWAFGSDLRSPADSSLGRIAARALRSLNLVFYQSVELLEHAANLLKTSASELARGRHVVLAHGIPEPPPIDQERSRLKMRQQLGIRENQIVLVSVGRIVRDKGVFEMLDAFEHASCQCPELVGLLIGSSPAHDDSDGVRKLIQEKPALRERFRLLSSCTPEKVWSYLAAADIYVFASHKEGMPNSLLEAMATGLPAVAFAIPPVAEIEQGTGGILLVPPGDVTAFAHGIVRLCTSENLRKTVGVIAQTEVRKRFMVKKNIAQAFGLLQTMVKEYNLNRFGVAARY